MKLVILGMGISLVGGYLVGSAVGSGNIVVSVVGLALAQAGIYVISKSGV